MGLTAPLTTEELIALCSRAFPDRTRQTLSRVAQIASRQHEMLGFKLWWQNDDSDVQEEDLIARRYKSTLSWWRLDDRGKAQREATVCRWLTGQGFPVPAVYLREFGAKGDVAVFARLPNDPLPLGERPLREIVEPIAGDLAKLLARLHSLEPGDAVRQVVPQVTLPGAVANLSAIAYQVDQPALQSAVERIMLHAYDVQESEPVLVHGDYHLLNALLKDGEIIGVVDWEYCALGDPRWDVSNAYMQLVDFGAAAAADRFLNTYLEYSALTFEGPPLFNAVTTLQQWAVSEWLVEQEARDELPGFALAKDLIALRDVHRKRAERAIEQID